MEQLSNAHNVARLGAGVCINPETKKPNYRGTISELLSNPKYRQAAEAFAKKYADLSAERQAIEISLRCEQLIRLKKSLKVKSSH
jgi:UDP:flavonoid glycosyltransferase YjiC (YdhE family)